MMTLVKERREAYVEVIEILKHMDKKYVSKIPLELREFFERNASQDYKFHINNKIPFEEYKLKESTINILAMLNINYWCENEEHKKELLKKYRGNDLRKQEELENIYNVDNLFKRERKVVSLIETENLTNIPVQYEETKWYKKAYNRILRIIKNIFNKY